MSKCMAGNSQGISDGLLTLDDASDYELQNVSHAGHLWDGSTTAHVALSGSRMCTLPPKPCTQSRALADACIHYVHMCAAIKLRFLV